MNSILLADDSVHAQRMGERILREEGFEVTVAENGEAALARLSSSDPDLLIADVFLPGTSGYELCQLVKTERRHRHMRVVLTAGLLETVDERLAIEVGCDSIIMKPFEASAVVETIQPLVQAASFARGLFAEQIAAEPATPTTISTTARSIPNLDAERVRAAVTIALDRALPKMIAEITERVLIALGH